MDHLSDKWPYAKCDHIPRLKDEYIELDKDLEKAILEEAVIVPLFEKQFHLFRQKRTVSLVHNELLRCRWSEFIKRKDQKILFRFPTINDLHFSNCAVRYNPKESICNRTNNRFHLRMGPGVDKYGQIPVPDDVNVRKTVQQTPKHQKPKATKDRKGEKKVTSSKKKNI